MESDVLRYEKEAWASGFSCVAGIDEAGRGPLAGPVVAAAVCFPAEMLAGGVPEPFRGLTDSKALSEKQRERFFALIEETPEIRRAVAVVSAEEIDRLNILRATHRAMAEAAQAVGADFALVDGLPVKGLPCPSRSIVKGDALSLSISAASILAKVTRDRIMCELDRRFPGYGFADHKGYGTAAHLAALRRLGPCPEHRRSFRPVAELDQLDLGF